LNSAYLTAAVHSEDRASRSASSAGVFRAGRPLEPAAVLDQGDVARAARDVDVGELFFCEREGKRARPRLVAGQIVDFFQIRSS